MATDRKEEEMKKEQIVCVEWEDASYDSGYYDKKEPERFEPVKVLTVGFVAEKTHKKIVVCIDKFHLEEGKIDLRHCSTIPRKYITKIRYLEDKK